MNQRQNKRNRRRIDEATNKTAKSLKSRFTLISSAQVKTWKAFIILIFIAGFFAALILGSYNHWNAESEAAIVKKDITPPVRSEGKFYRYTTNWVRFEQVLLTLKTNEPAECRYSLNPGIFFDQMKDKFEFSSYQRAFLAGRTMIVAKTTRFYVRCKDSSGNVNKDDYILTWAGDRKK